MLIVVDQVQGQAATLIALGALFFFLALVGPNVATLLQGCCVSRLTCSATGIENGIANGMGALGPVIFGLAAAMTGSYDAALPIMVVLLALSGVVILRFKVVGPVTCPVDRKGAGD